MQIGSAIAARALVALFQINERCAMRGLRGGQAPVIFEDKLGILLRRLPGHIYAVLDGAHFDDLSGRLRQTSLRSRALYVDEIDMPRIDSGPHLIDCTSNFAVEQVRDVTADAPSVVWWGWHTGGLEGMRSITGHLRRLNLMDVPEGAETGTTPRYGDIHAPGSAEPVLFRHADPDVIASILPELSPIQRAQLFGGAHAIIADPAAAEPVMLSNLAFGRPAPGGRLSLSVAQYSGLSRAYGVALRRRAVFEFRAGLSAREKASRAERVRDAIDRAESYGCATKEQVWDFIRLDLRHGVRFELAPARQGVLEQLRNDEVSPGERLFRAEQELAFLERHGEP
jgi:hypothetical protein